MRFTALLAFLLVACGNSAETKTPSAASTSEASPTSPSAAAETTPPAASSAPPEEPKSRGKPFELYNSCTQVVTVIVGKDPKAADAGRRTAAPSSSIELPRDGAGNQIVWLVDEKSGEATVHVTVTRGIKRVEVGRSCATLNAN